MRFLSLTSIALLATTSSVLAVDLTKVRQFKRDEPQPCVPAIKAEVQKIWNTKTSNVSAAICYYGSYTLAMTAPDRYLYVGVRSCAANDFWESTKLLHCFYLYGENTFTINDDGGSENLGMIYKSNCKWDGKTLFCVPF